MSMESIRKLSTFSLIQNEEGKMQQNGYKNIVHGTTNYLIACVLPFVFRLNFSYSELSWLLVFNELNEWMGYGKDKDMVCLKGAKLIFHTQTER